MKISFKYMKERGSNYYRATVERTGVRDFRERERERERERKRERERESDL